MRITFYGAASEVGRSCMLLEEDNKNMMLDCGIKLGEKTEYPLLDDQGFRRVDDIVISHAHMDHSGYLPHVYSKGARPRIWLTKPTRDLMNVLLADYHKICVSDNDKRLQFSIKDVKGILHDARMVRYNTRIGGNFHFTLHNAGHIIGSAMIRIDHKAGILYSGDICMRRTRVLNPCEQGLRAETLIVESTYGTKGEAVPSLKEASANLIKSAKVTLNQGGHVIIPSFAVGRAQEVLLLLDEHIRNGMLPKTKIYVEGMIGKVMKIHGQNKFYANDEIKKRILLSDDDPFKSPAFHSSKSKDRKDVLKEPCIIVSTSGMLSGGPVLQYLEKLGNNPKNKMIFVGYQAPGTRGRKVLDGERKIMIGEKEIELKMEVEQVRLSGHADFNELLQFVRGVKGLKKVFVVHGEKTDLAEALGNRYEVVVPKLGENFRI